MKIYISGPITGIENGNKEAFDFAETALRARGHETVNPHSLPHDHDKSWEAYMREDLRAMMDCDAVFALAGWSRSRGATVEVELAEVLGMPVHESVREL